jgi:hypothetical protein
MKTTMTCQKTKQGMHKLKILDNPIQETSKTKTVTLLYVINIKRYSYHLQPRKKDHRPDLQFDCRAQYDEESVYRKETRCGCRPPLLK